MAHLYIFGTIFFTVYGQLVIKWRIPNYGHLPEQTIEKIIFLLKLFLDPFILSGFVSAFVASLDRKSTRLNSSHLKLSRMPSSA